MSLARAPQKYRSLLQMIGLFCRALLQKRPSSYISLTETGEEGRRDGTTIPISDAAKFAAMEDNAKAVTAFIEK